MYLDFDALSVLSVRKVDGLQFPCFEVTHTSNPHLPHRFYVRSEEEADEWVEVLANDSYEKVRLNRASWAMAVRQWENECQDLSARLEWADYRVREYGRGQRELGMAREVRNIMLDQMEDCVDWALALPATASPKRHRQ